MQVCTERTSYCGVPPAYQCVSIVLENVSLLYVCCKSSACKVAFMWFPALIGLSDISKECTAWQPLVKLCMACASRLQSCSRWVHAATALGTALLFPVLLGFLRFMQHASSDLKYCTFHFVISTLPAEQGDGISAQAIVHPHE